MQRHKRTPVGESHSNELVDLARQGEATHEYNHRHMCIHDARLGACVRCVLHPGALTHSNLTLFSTNSGHTHRSPFFI